MVRTRRSEPGQLGRQLQRALATAHARDQEVSVDGWSPRELRSHFRVTRKRQHWPTKLVSRRLSTLKMPRIMYPESEDTDAEKFTRRSRPVRVFFKGEKRVCRVKKGRHSDVVERQLRPLQPSNYMEESDKNMQDTESHVRRSGRQRKLIHHSYNESWITDDIKVKGYPRLFNRHRRITSSSESSSEDERLQPSNMNKQVNGDAQSEDDNQTDKTPIKKSPNQTTTKIKKDFKTEEETDPKEICENGSTAIDSDKSETKKIIEQEENKVNLEEGHETKDMTTSRCLRSRQTPRNRRNIRNRKQMKKSNTRNNSHSQESASDSDNSSDSERSDIVVGNCRRKLRRSNRTRKPRSSFIESASCEGKQYTLRKKPYNMRKQYSLRERKKPKMIVRSQSPSSSTSNSSTSSETEEDLNVSVKNKTKTRQKSKTLGDHGDRALRDIQPVQIDGNIRFSSVGGLEEHIRCLREMVLFPLMYPQLFEKFGTQPPKGVLFHGPPGTGKTLLARALANECTIQGGQKVSFFMRKGADCLKKWVGESERNIKLLFQQASKMKPSIIFFDEIDALAPVRSARQDQVHTSVVGTLLAEMDGLCDRGEIIVIGATNRLDAVDPALRRAGRFDRELHFPTPPANQRAAILHVLTSSWNPLPSNDTIQFIANISTGYGGSDLKALCSESVLKALERTYPQVYRTQQALLIDTQKIEVLREDMICAMRSLIAAASRCAPPPTRSLPPHLIPLLASNLNAVINIAKAIFPPAEKSSTAGNEMINEHHMSNHLWSSVLLLRGSCSTTLLGPALLAAVEHCAIRELSISTLNQGITLTHEHAILAIFAEIRRCSQSDKGCILYVPSIDIFWPILGESGSNLVMHLWQEISATNNCFLIATTESTFNDLPHQVQQLFPSYKDCLFNIKEPTVAEITAFLKPVFISKALEPIFTTKHVELPRLAKAPPPPAPRPTAAELRRSARREAHLLRELRIFLRDVCRKLAANRRFYKFTKPVDLEEVTDYLTIIKQPMDLETMMTKVDMHRYNCARDFLKDVDLICANALEYNPDRTSSDKQIRHEACSLRDHAYALVEVEMDTDFEEECRTIAAQRATSGEAIVDKDLPSFIFTANQSVTNMSVQFDATIDQTSNSNMADGDLEAASSNTHNSHHSNKRKRKKRQSLWSKGMVAKKAKSNAPKDNPIITDEESKENKPLCSSPLNGEPSLTDNDTGPSEHDHGSSKDKSNDAINDVSHGIIKKINLEKDEMLFDANAVDGVADVNRMIDRPLSPDTNGEHPASNMFTSTPHRKKSSSLEHSIKDCDTKLIVNKEELETALQKSVKILKGVRLKPLVDLYCQLDRVLNKYSTQCDRSNLPSELQNTVHKFKEALSSK